MTTLLKAGQTTEATEAEFISLTNCLVLSFGRKTPEVVLNERNFLLAQDVLDECRADATGINRHRI